MKKSYGKLEFDNKCVKMVRQILENKSTVKKEVYREKNPKLYHRLVQTVVENYDLLLSTIKKCKYMEDDLEMGVIRCFQILDRRLKNTRMRKKFIKAMDGVELKFTRNPLFVRINTLKGGRRDDIETLCPEETSIENVYKVLNQGDINNLCAYRDGRVIIQNIASCLPAYILNPEENSKVIDTCSAPGNKTSHLSMLMNNTGKIYAFEIDDNRVNTLIAQLEKLGVTNVEVIHEDFMNSSPQDFKDIKYVLCDPSCSGSGIHLNYKTDLDRVNKLKSFQIMIVLHALKFEPDKLVYSVCSSHKEEGEEVVEEVLKNSEYELENISRYWKSDVSFGFPFSQKVIRCQSSSSSGTIGFFVALFVRKNRSLKGPKSVE